VTDRAPFPRFLPGDRLVVTAKIARPREDADFRYDLFLRTRGIDATIPFASLQMIGRDSTLWFSLLRSIALFRQVLIDHAHSILPFPHASLLMGLTIGADGTIPQSALTDFRTAGLTHILAVSGSNVTMLLTLLCTLLFFLPLRWRVGPLLFGVVAFTFLVGADAPVVRASIMGIIGLFALLSERKTIPVFTLLLTLSVMVLWNPLSLLYDPGFQLSFLATLGITLFSPRLLRFFSFLPSCFALRESFATTVAAFLFTLPVSVLVFHQLSLVAPLANVLAAPLIAPAMLFGLCAVLLSFLSLSLGVLSASVGWVFLDLLMQIAHYCALVPFALFSFQT
jgi:competence protein ComEC